MAQNADGSVIITTSIDTSNITTGIADVEKEIGRLSSGFEGLKNQIGKSMDADFASAFTSDVEKVENQISDLQDKLKSIGGTTFKTDQYQSIEDTYDQVIAKADELRAKLNLLNRQGVSPDTQRYKSVKAEYDATVVSVDNLRAALDRLESSGEAYVPGVDTSQYAQAGAEIDRLSQKIEDLKQKSSEIGGKFKGIGTTIATAMQSPLQAVGRVLGATVQKIGQIGSKALQAGKAFAQWSINHIVSGLKSAASGLKNMVTGANSMGGKFSSLASEAKSFAVGLLGARSIFTILQNAVNAYMQQNQQLSATLSNVWANLGSLLGPIIERIINLLSTAVSYVTQFFSLLGITSKKVSSAIGGAGSAAAAETKKLKKQLASFDELNVLQDNSSGGGGGGGGGAGGIGADGAAEVKLPDWAKLMAEQLKNGKWAEAATTLTDQLNAMVASVDWAGIGDKIGYYLNGALTFLATAITTFNWTALGADLGTMLNNIITSVDWGNLGTLLMAKWAILLQLLAGFFETFDGKAFGDGLYSLLMGAVNACDWVGLTGELSKNISNFIQAIDFEKLGTALSTGVRTILQSFNIAIADFDWRGLGEKIADFINGIDWAGIIGDLVTLISNVQKAALNLLIGFAEKLDWSKLGHDLFDSLKSVVQNTDWGGIVSLAFELLGAAISGALSLIVTLAVDFWNLLKEGWESTKSYFSSYIEEAGGNIIEGLWNGIVNALKNVGNWIVDHIFQPFIDGFKAAFGIHSPSTVMEEQGNYIIEGLLQGITNAWKGITEFIGNSLTSIKNTISTAWSNVKSTASQKWSEIRSAVTSTWENLKSGAADKFNALKTNVLNAWNSIKNSPAWQTISSALSTTWTNMKNKATTTFNGMKTSIVNIFNGLKNAIKSPVNAIIGFINGMISGIVSGINSAISVLNRLHISIPRWVPGIGGRSLGFNIPHVSAPHIPYLAKGAVIPPNAPFMAMLGDQRHGTNVEAPLETIQEAVALVMDGMTGGMMTGFEAVIAILREILEAIMGIEIGDDVIANAVKNYNRKMAVVNGG